MYLFITLKSLPVNVNISLHRSIMNQGVNASYLAEGPAPPMFSLKAVHPWPDCRAIPGSECTACTELSSVSEVVPCYKELPDCCHMRSCFSGLCIYMQGLWWAPSHNRIADLAGTIASRFLERSLPGQTVLLVATSTASACLHSSMNYAFPESLAAVTSVLN